MKTQKTREGRECAQFTQMVVTKWRILSLQLYHGTQNPEEEKGF